MQDRVKKVRQSLDLSQEAFGRALGVTKTAICGIEAGRRGLTEQMAKSICREFDVSEEWLRDGTGEMFRTHDDETAALVYNFLADAEKDDFCADLLELIRTYEQLDPESRQLVQKSYRLLFEKNKKNVKTREE